MRGCKPLDGTSEAKGEGTVKIGVRGANLCGACRGLYLYLGEEALAEAASLAETEQGN